MFKKIIQKIKSKIFAYKIEKGIIPRGRTLEKPFGIPILMGKGKGKVTISARHIKANGEVKNLGIIYQSKE